MGNAGGAKFKPSAKIIWAHHAATLGATDFVTYEVSRAVATTVAFRSFMTELGFPQLLGILTKPVRRV